MTLLYVSYGVWNANNPIIKTKQVEISNVPEVWKNKKIIFFSDLHIGKII
ncbi:MAG: hypothetical protein LBD88_04765 [Candidatus Peribacteria bacterium]|nr:hypothetical protein [Candidatus Peribacteria bacterium]